MKKLLTSITAMLALAAAAAPVAAAEALPQWYAKGHRIAAGETDPVQIAGHSTLYLFSLGVRATCHTTGTGTVANVEGQGVESVTSAAFSNCRGESGVGETLSYQLCPAHTKPEIAPEGLPWSGKIDRYLRAQYEGVELKLFCSGSNNASTVKGTIGGLVGTNSLQFGLPALGEEQPVNTLELGLFTGIWHLEGPEGKRAITAILT